MDSMNEVEKKVGGIVASYLGMALQTSLMLLVAYVISLTDTPRWMVSILYLVTLARCVLFVAFHIWLHIVTLGGNNELSR